MVRHKNFVYRFGQLVAALLLVFMAVNARADSARFQQYQYDGAGNLVGVSSVVLTGAPVVDSLTPNQVRQNTSLLVTVSGNNLLGLQVSSASAALTATAVSDELTSAVFELTIPLGTAAGNYSLEFTTTLGSASADITVIAGVPPQLLVTPDPLLLSAGGGPLAVAVALSGVDNFAHELIVTTDDAAVATVSGTLTIPVGSTEAVGVLLITPVDFGSTTLVVSAPLLSEVRLPVYVTEPFAGVATPVSAPLGVALTIDEPLSGSVVPVSAALGVALTIDEPLSGSVVPVSAALGVALTIDEPLSGSVVPVSAALGVALTIDEPLSGSVVPVSAALGVALTIDEPLSGSVVPVTQPLGVHVGPLVDSLLPVVLTIGVNDQLTLMGENLDLVTAVRFEPEDPEITFGVPAVNPAGTQLDVTVNVGASATPAIRVLFLDGGFGSVPLQTAIEIIP